MQCLSSAPRHRWSYQARSVHSCMLVHAHRSYSSTAQGRRCDMIAARIIDDRTAQMAALQLRTTPAGAVHERRFRQRAFAANVSSSRRPAVVCHAAAPAATEDAASRRQLLLSMVTAAPVLTAVSATPAAQAAAAGTCEFVTAANGIQYCDTKEGEGPSPVKGALIRCHYTGRLASNNRVFDSSYERGRPLTFKVGVGEVIRGWDAGILGAEGIPPMKEGGKRTLIIPAELAYGARGAGGVIPPNAALVFDVELLGKRR